MLSEAHLNWWIWVLTLGSLVPAGEEELAPGSLSGATCRSSTIELAAKGSRSEGQGRDQS